MSDYDETFKNAIQSRLTDGNGFYTYTDGNGREIAIWTLTPETFMETLTVSDIWCDMSLLEGMTYDESLNYGDIESYA